MGRVKLQLKKIETKDYRHISFAKRKDGLIKKAYELSTLCDVDVALIFFSPAGKLVLFDGKRRIEEIIKRYIDLPHHLRGRISNQEMVYRVLTQMGLESELWRQLNSSSSDEDRRMTEIRLERIQNQISLRSIELEDVEKQLEYFVKSSSSIKSITKAEYHESVLEDALRRLSLRKQVLKRNVCSEISSETLQPQTATTTNFMMGNPSYGLGWPQQNDHLQILPTNFAIPTGFQIMRNESEPFAEMLPSSMALRGTAGYLTGNAVSNDFDEHQSSMAFYGAEYQAGNPVSGDPNQLAPSMQFRSAGYLPGNEVSGEPNQLAPSIQFHGAGYLAGNEVSGGSNQLAHSMQLRGTRYLPEYDRFFNGSFAPRMNNIQQGRTTPTAFGPSQVVHNNVARASHGSTPSLHGLSDMRFPF